MNKDNSLPALWFYNSWTQEVYTAVPHKDVSKVVNEQKNKKALKAACDTREY